MGSPSWLSTLMMTVRSCMKLLVHRTRHSSIPDRKYVAKQKLVTNLAIAVGRKIFMFGERAMRQDSHGDGEGKVPVHFSGSALEP